ncbi:MAG: hypothetical protein AB7N65_27865 [Vicinamibacterales bacterium]
MTKPKDPTNQRRLLVGRSEESVSEALDWLEWATGDHARVIAVDLARAHYLSALTRVTPRVLDELKRLRADDDSGLATWAQRWRLGEWGIVWGRQTLSLSRGRYWVPPVEGTAILVSERRAAIRRSPAEIARAAPLVHAESFAWLAQYQTGRPYLWIARREASTVGNVRRDCGRLAELLDIPLRVTRRGPQRVKRLRRSSQD